MTAKLGQLLFTRRHNLGFTLQATSAEMGGSPTESYIWRIEEGKAPLSPSAALRLAKALRLPEDLVLNAAGHVTTQQQHSALDKLFDLIGESRPIRVGMPVLDVETGEPTRERVSHVLRSREEAFVVRLSGQKESMFDGECIVVRGRQPADGQGVVIRREGRLSAAIFRNGTLTRAGETVEGEVMGVIIRVVTQHDFA